MGINLWAKNTESHCHTHHAARQCINAYGINGQSFLRAATVAALLRHRFRPSHELPHQPVQSLRVLACERPLLNGPVRIYSSVASSFYWNDGQPAYFAAPITTGLNLPAASRPGLGAEYRKTHFLTRRLRGANAQFSFTLSNGHFKFRGALCPLIGRKGFGPFNDFRVGKVRWWRQLHALKHINQQCIEYK